MAFRRRSAAAGSTIFGVVVPLGIATAAPSTAFAAGLAILLLLASTAAPAAAKASSSNRKLMLQGSDDYYSYYSAGAGYGPAGTYYTPTTPTTDYTFPQTEPGGGAGGYGGCEDPDAALSTTNQYRAIHGAPALSWSDGLASEAQNLAQSLANSGCYLQHSGSPGESLYMYSYSGGVSLNCENAVQTWYSEESNYMYSYTPWSDNSLQATGHFTQLVWKSTSEVGCGAAAGNGGTCYVVACRYWPPGNTRGDEEYLMNVEPPQ
ncbi:hypothetical protein PLESTB_001813100 [Pleodorina starrii]|uniref:SCP domain-containing protein n=1 Tax=Pleodorina starrii TaxID=330485 RepID=A0A9W6F9Y4_9CHLO|nr:hypothetical protein PLESTB_001813100 [Pleodorina starrii]